MCSPCKARISFDREMILSIRHFLKERSLKEIPSILNNNIPHSGGIAAKNATEKRSSDI